jgi:hypothetical protein
MAATKFVRFMLAALCASLPAAALTLPLNHQRVETSIDGMRVALYISGPVTIDFNGSEVAIRADASIDLSEIQKNFAAIVLARSVDRKCGDSITLKNASLNAPKDSAAAEVTATATIRRVQCDASGQALGAPAVVSGPLALRLQPRVAEHGQLAFDITPAPATEAKVAALLVDHALSEALASMIAGTLTSSAGATSVTMALHRDAASYEPRIESAAFERLPDNHLGTHLILTLKVPTAKFFEWKIGQ